MLLGTVSDIDTQAKPVVLEDGTSLDFDSLIVAAGSQSSYYGHDAWSERAPGLKSVEEATTVRHKILYAFEIAERIPDDIQRRAWLTFVIVGAGATGVELAGAIAEIARQTLKDDFRSIHPREAQIVLVDASPRVLSTFPDDLAEKARRSLTRLGVQIKNGVMVKDIDKEGVTFQGREGNDRLEARTVIWAGGVAGEVLGRILAQKTKADTDRAGRIKVGPGLAIAGYPDVYVAGDLALSVGLNGKPLPGVAQVAMQQGTYAAKNIIRKVQGEKELPAFKYFDKGNLAAIGRWAAVADTFRVHLSGFPAWFVWAFIHLLYIVQFQSRILVFTQWAIQDLTFNRGARLITWNAPTDCSFNQELASVGKKNLESRWC